MKRKLEISELIFKVISYTLLTVFALCCLYPFVYAISASISGRSAVEYGSIVLFPKDVQFDAFKLMFKIFGQGFSVIQSPRGIALLFLLLYLYPLFLLFSLYANKRLRMCVLCDILYV